MPDAIQNAPELLPGLQLYWQAFFDLDRDRHIGFGGDGPIPWRSTQQYAEDHGLDDEQIEALHHHIKAMDAAMMKHKAAKAKANKPPPLRRVIRKR